MWLLEAMWDIIYVFILGSILFLWRPTNNSQRYAYYDETIGEDSGDDEEYGDDLPEDELDNYSDDDDLNNIDVEEAIERMISRKKRQSNQGKSNGNEGTAVEMVDIIDEGQSDISNFDIGDDEEDEVLFSSTNDK